MRQTLTLVFLALFALSLLACGGTQEPPVEPEAPASQAAEPAEPAEPPLFSSDFEGGDTSEWSEAQEGVPVDDDSSQ